MTSALHTDPLACDRGVIYWAEVLPEETRGSEQQKLRCWVVVSSRERVNVRYPIIVGVPLSVEGKLNSPTRVEIRAEDVQADPGVSAVAMVALVEQVRVLSVQRVVGRYGVLRSDALCRVEAALRLVLYLQ